VYAIYHTILAVATSCTGQTDPRSFPLLVSQCAKAVLRCPDTGSAAAALCELASVRGSMDNITALVVDLRLKR